MADTIPDPKARLLDAALAHVPFDGWSNATFEAAIKQSEMDRTVARAICPRGALDLAVAFHKRGDAQMLERLTEADLEGMKFRDRVAAAVRYRLEVVEDKEVVRRGTALFALPQHAAEGAKLIWGTADEIWTALGDTSDDVNWYTKRATLSAVYSSTVLYWLGDNSADNEATWGFLDRRIDNVMQIEKLKAQVNGSPTLSRLMAGPNWVLSHVKAPPRVPKSGLPGSWTMPRGQ
jgi:ubiquinone biosynthesis protein COQ9